MSVAWAILTISAVSVGCFFFMVGDNRIAALSRRPLSTARLDQGG